MIFTASLALPGDASEGSDWQWLPRVSELRLEASSFRLFPEAVVTLAVSVPVDLQETLLRIGSATLMGMIVGIERDWHHKPAGVRVLAMVSMASAAVTMSSVSILGMDHSGEALRTVQGVLSSVGFLGAVVILYQFQLKPASFFTTTIGSACCEKEPRMK